MKTNKIHLSLSTYSAMAAGFIAGTNTVNAQVIFTDVDPDFVYTEPVSGYQSGYEQIDFNADGFIELSIGFSSFTFNGLCYGAGSMSLYAINNASILVTNTVAGNQIKILNDGDLISAGAVWNTANYQTFMISDFYRDNCDTDIEYPDISGNWINADGKYFGVRFKVGADFHYGWVRLTSQILVDSGDAEIDTIRLHGFAYEALANTGIIAGVGYISVNDAIREYTIDASVYPNPVSDYLKISIKETPQNFSFVLFDLHGKIILQNPISSSIEMIPFNTLESGIYLLSILDAQGNLAYAEKIIKL